MRSLESKAQIAKTHKALSKKLLDSGLEYRETEKKSERFNEVKSFFSKLNGPQSHPGVKIEEIDLSQNDREIDKNSEEFKALKESIRSQGLLQRPILTLGLSSHKPFLCVAGHRRILAYIELGFAIVPAELILTKSENEVRMARLAENIVRQSLKPLELAEAVFRMKESLGEIQGVARLLNKNRNYISRLCKVACWPEEAKRIVHDFGLNQKQVISIAMKKLNNQQVVEELLKIVSPNDATQCSTPRKVDAKGLSPKNISKIDNFVKLKKLNSRDKELIYEFLREVNIKGWIPE